MLPPPPWNERCSLQHSFSQAPPLPFDEKMILRAPRTSIRVTCFSYISSSTFDKADCLRWAWSPAPFRSSTHVEIFSDNWTLLSQLRKCDLTLLSSLLLVFVERLRQRGEAFHEWHSSPPVFRNPDIEVVPSGRTFPPRSLLPSFKLFGPGPPGNTFWQPANTCFQKSRPPFLAPPVIR